MRRSLRQLALAILALACAGAGAARTDPKNHWSYRPLVAPAVPQVTDGASERNPIDAFIGAKRQAAGMAPSPEADRRTLIRRVSFDLTGLPPTPEEVRTFLTDNSPGAYERLVDRLLASPRYGERWASHWIDVVHFAETHGHEHDIVRPNAWPYRDYLIRSFNEDKPYGRFVEEQLAGDALYAADPQATIALGFLGAGPWDESSQMTIVDDTVDKAIARNLDRDDILTTTMSTFASTTVHCARCHDHKFDPVSIKEYYNLQSCFAGIDRAERPYDADPDVHRTRQDLLSRRHQLNDPKRRAAVAAALLVPAVQSQAAAWESSLPSAEKVWTVLKPLGVTSHSLAVLTPQPDGSVLATGERPEKDTYYVTADTDLKHITAVRVEVMADERLPSKGPGRADNGNFHLTELRLWASPQRDDVPPTKIELHNASADFDQKNFGSETAIDGKGETGWGVDPAEGKSHFAVFETKQPIEGFASGTTLKFVLEQNVGRKHTIGRVRVSVTTARPPVKAKPAPDEILAILAVPAAQRTDAQRVDLAAHVLKVGIDERLKALPAPAMVYAGTTDFVPASYFTPAKGPRPVSVLKRGDVTQPIAPATPGGLACVPGLDATFSISDPSDEAARRAALAKWMTDPKNVLTWRSIVNRAWHYHFGRGLCDTPNDLGLMGGEPSHPELIDWLAVWFKGEAKGSLKSLHRLMVTSATYRQSSAHNSAYAKLDADNRLLWRMNRTRLDAESVRDALLVVTGKIDLTMGGPSAQQFIMTAGIAQTPNLDYDGFDPDAPGNFRRSIYRFLYRTLPDPFMESMDCPDLSQLTPVRSTSVTALQALAMLNDKFIVRQSEHLAERAAKTSPDVASQINTIYDLALNRAATPREIELLSAYCKKHGMANVCRLVLNSNEFMFVN